MNSTIQQYGTNHFKLIQRHLPRQKNNFGHTLIGPEDGKDDGHWKEAQTDLASKIGTKVLTIWQVTIEAKWERA
ncbi:MAG: hypothetical protein R6V33_02100 [Pelovirga sp.]